MSTAYFRGIDLYDNANPKILEFYAQEKTVLDIGCGSGLLGKTIKALNPGAIVFGVDYSPSAGEQAAKVLDRYDTVDLDNQPLPAYDRRFDLIVLADVLEHLKRPDEMLAKTRFLLNPGGAVLISVPNIAHFRIRKSLLAGRFRYADTGILDRTHLKFFTYETLAQMVHQCGFDVVAEKYIAELPGLFGITPRKSSALHEYVARTLPRLVAVQFVFKLLPKHP